MKFFLSITRFLCISILMINIGLAQEEGVDLSDVDMESARIPEHDDGFESIGQWIKRGSAMEEAPVCYQLWKCVASNNVDDSSSASAPLPEGTWGICENFLNAENAVSMCSACNAPMPQNTCQ